MMIRPLLAIAAAATLLATAATGNDLATSPEDMAKAQQQLAARLEAADVGALPPLLSDPSDAAMIRAALDPRGLRPVSVATLGEGLMTCGATVRYSTALSLAGSRPGEFKDVAADQAARTITARSKANTERFQDEVALSIRYSTICMARLIEPLARFWETLPDSQRTTVRLGGLRQVRGGLSEAYIGIVMIQVDPASTLANRTMLMETLLAINPRLAQGLSPADRQLVLGAIARHLPVAGGPEKADLIRLRDQLAALPCLQLCAI